MTEIKFRHKVLIFIAVTWVLLRLSSIKLPKILQHKSRPPQDVPQRRVEPAPQRRAEPARAPTPCAPNRAVASGCEDTPTGIHIDDETFRRFYGTS